MSWQKHKILITVVVILIAIILLLPVVSYRPVYEKDELSYGVTFSLRFAQEMGLNWQKVYEEMLDDLDVKKVRLIAYWDQVEYKDGMYWWKDLDWQIKQASSRDVEIILAVGGRLPRWPECHFPEWTKELSNNEREEKILEYIKEVVKRYQKEENIIAWQIENEPFLTHFGECPKISSKFLDKEIALARSLDNRPIVVTDSGELSIWTPAMQRADIFGTTMYRDVYSGFLGRYVHYPLPPAFFKLKYNLAMFFSAPKPKNSVVIELQAEPWGPKPYYTLTKQERERTMNLEKFKEMLEYSRKTGFKEFYLWGVEWWYWEKEVNGDWSLWEEAKILF